MEAKYRRRLNIAISTKGVHTFDSTTESDTCTIEALRGEVRKLAIAGHQLVEELDKLYPPKGKE